jgi:DNA transformation protein
MTAGSRPPGKVVNELVNMAVSPEFLDFIRDQLQMFGETSMRRMFGGAGVFHDGLMIALVTGETLYLKVDDRSRPDFEAAGMGPFSYDRRGRAAVIGSYYEAPPDVLEDAEELVAWARRAYEAALAAAKAKPKKRR